MQLGTEWRGGILSAISTNASAGQRWFAPDAPDLKEVGRALKRIARDATRALLNLVLNAIDAMRSVSGRTRVLHVGAQRRGATEVDVWVRHSGVGLDASRRDRVFDPFHTPKPDGMGMGLVIGRSIVQAHGGHLRITANEDFGDTFHFTLPLVTANA
jgi:signal transduction histidine kinase